MAARAGDPCASRTCRRTARRQGTWRYVAIPTFVYAPQIRVRVATQKDGVLDISEDLVAGNLAIRTNGVHTFSFQLQNALRKYDRVIRPMDRIVVEMKRIAWVRVFSGYLNNGPIFSVWPRVLSLTASCTLKRLQFWYWDSTSSAAVKLIEGALTGGQTDQTDPTRTENNETAAGQSEQIAQDAGVVGKDKQVREGVVKILSEVVAWPQEKVHLAEIPEDWYKLAEEVYNEVSAETDQVVSLIGDFASGGTVGGSGGGGGVANGVLMAGTYGGVTYTQDQANNASAIYNAAVGSGFGPAGAILGIMAAWQESTMNNINYGDRDSLGLFQQRAPWGPREIRTNPVESAKMFYNGGQGGQPGLRAYPWQTMPRGKAIQSVQRSAFPDAYDKHFATAQAAVDVINRSPGAGQVSGGSGATIGGGSVGATTPGNAPIPASTAPAPPAAAGTPPKVGSGRNVALVAANLIKSKPPGHIRYRLGNDDHYTNPDPRVLDCSSLVDWVYYHAVGRPIQQGRTNTRFLTGWTKRMSVENAKYVKGALLFMGGISGVHHVEVSLGNGMTAGAHTDSVPLEKQVTVGPAGGGWSHAGLMPGVDYSDAATNQAAASEVGSVLGIPTTISDPNETGTGTDAGGAGGASGSSGPDGNAAFNAFINVYIWGLKVDASGDYLAGSRALMNDEPILPYISNLLGTIMRSWCSAPNGDFMAWFPDYFGLWDSAAKMNVRSIELMDFTVEWYDQEIVTHQYVVGAPIQTFDTRTATVTGSGGTGKFEGLNWMLASKGIATVDFPKIFKAIFGKEGSQQFIQEYLDRFGGRPNVVNMPAIQNNSNNEFFMALYLWMQRWANQFRANVPMTFMPELWPGMLLCLPEYDFQAYILEVTHQFKFGPGGGFHTTAKICAPARTKERTDIFGLLPLAGSGRPDSRSESQGAG